MRVDYDTLIKLDTITAMTGKTRSEVVREGIDLVYDRTQRMDTGEV